VSPPNRPEKPSHWLQIADRRDDIAMFFMYFQYVMTAAGKLNRRQPVA
jgi:hypothetical protein